MFKGLGNLADMGNLMKQFQTMQAKLAEIEDELAGLTLEGSSGGGMVTVEVNGKQELRKITIETELLNPEERDMLQDMIVAACNQALEASRQLRLQKMAEITGGVKIPGLM